MAATIRFSGDIKKFERFMSRRGMRLLEQEVGKATARNAALLQDAIIERIKTRRFKKKKSPLTLALSKSDIPLIDTTDMMRAVETELQGAFVAFVGFLKNQKTSHGAELRQIVPLLEKGFEVRLTAKMRRFLFLRMRQAGVAGPGGGPSQTSGDGVLRIPPRPFITPVFKSRRMQAKINTNWRDAVKRWAKMVGAL